MKAPHLQRLLYKKSITHLILATEILGAGTENVSGAIYTGANNSSGSQFGTENYYSQAGIFSGGLSSGLDFDSGIFLSTGYVMDDYSDGNLSSTLATDGVSSDDPRP